MNKNSKIVKKYVLVSWQDADVADQIKDRSFGGKLLASSNNNKENQNDAGELVKVAEKKKKRISKRVSNIMGGDEANNVNKDGDLSSIGLTNATTDPTLVARKQPAFAKISNHFVFGSQANATAADGFATMTKTSNNKLDQSQRISYVDMCEVIKNNENKHQRQLIESLNESLESEYFPKWFNLMSFGFNILMHGVGSKKSLIQKFAQVYLDNYFCVELLGYHHDFNTKNILKTIISDVLELNDNYKTFDEQLNVINQNLDKPLYLLIHNIDGSCFRETTIQYCLSELATNKFVHIMASVDHINSSLLWDQIQYGSFKWVNFEINTLMPYNDEIIFENSLMLSQTGNVQLSSMIHILKSLTQNAKNIFLIMVQYVLNADNTKKSITFTKLYHECREKFFVSNELTLRAQLTEFIDHKLIKLKTESDGYETIYLLIDDKNLKLYLEDLKDKV